jgi:hypothetical protein
MPIHSAVECHSPHSPGDFNAGLREQLTHIVCDIATADVLSLEVLEFVLNTSSARQSR